MPACGDIPPSSIFLGCCPTDRMKVLSWEVFQTGFAPFLPVLNIDRVFRKKVTLHQKFENDGAVRGELIGAIEETTIIPDPTNSMTHGGPCPVEFTRVVSGRFFSPPQFPVQETARSETELINEGVVPVSGYHRIAHTLSMPVDADWVFGKLDSIAARVPEVFDQVPWTQLPAPVPPVGRLEGDIGEACGGQLGLAHLVFPMSGLGGPHGIERGYMTVFRPSLVVNGMAHWRAYETAVYAELTPGRPYCLVTRRGIPFPHLHQEWEAHLDLVGGQTVSCTTQNATGSRIVVRAPRCDLNSNSAVDFYTALSRRPGTTEPLPPPLCCGPLQ